MIPCLRKSRTFRIPIYGSYNCQRSMHYENTLSVEEPKFKIVYRPERFKIMEKYPYNFVRDIFLGKMEPSFAKFPSVLDYDDLRVVKEYADSVKLLDNEINAQEILKEERIPKTVLQQIKDSNLFALAVPKHFNGHSFNETECSMVYENLTSNSLLCNMLASNQVVVDLIKWFGTDSQKVNYFSKQVTGESIGSLALADTERIEDFSSNLNTQAYLSEDGENWILNGTKMLVSYPSLADYFIVMTRTLLKSEEGVRVPTITFFIVDKSSQGVIVSINERKGISNSERGCVFFKDVLVPKENVLGTPHEGERILEKLMKSGKLSNAAQIIGQMKRLVDVTIAKCIEEKVLTHSPREINYIKLLIGKMCCITHTAESMHYVTTGFSDLYQDPDVMLESALTKVYASENLLKLIDLHLEIFGNSIYSRSNSRKNDNYDEYLSRLINDAYCFTVSDYGNIPLRLLVALHGLKHAGENMGVEVKKARNRLDFPFYVWKYLYELEFKYYPGRSFPKLHLHSYIHPSLDEQVTYLEKIIYEFKKVIRYILTKRGVKIIENHYDLLRISDIAMHIFALEATLSRTSFSYCEGLALADYERFMTHSNALNAVFVIDKHICYFNLPRNSEQLHEVVATKILDEKKYKFMNPHTPNY